MLEFERNRLVETFFDIKDKKEKFTQYTNRDFSEYKNLIRIKQQKLTPEIYQT